ncbi:protein MpNBS-LRR6 [Marchantia polymorpha subsp. ruderalis]
MAELVSVVIGFGVELLLQGVIDEVKQAVDRNKNCKALLVLLEGLAPLVQFLCDSSKKGQGQNKSTPVTEWLEKLRSRLEEADKVVRECISQGSRPWNIVKNRSTSKKLVEVTRGITDLVGQAPLVQLGYTKETTDEQNKILADLQESMKNANQLQSDLIHEVHCADLSRITRVTVNTPTEIFGRSVGTITLERAFEDIRGQADEHFLTLTQGSATGSSADVVPSPQRQFERQISARVFGGDELLDSARSILLEEEDGRRWVGLWSMGGAGKTLLASRLSNDLPLKQHFEGGIFWLTVARDPNIEEILRSLLRMLSARLPPPSSSEEVYAQQVCHELQLRGQRKRLLLVLDDVWKSRILDVFDAFVNHPSSSGSKILVTTRSKELLDRKHATKIEVRMLKPEDSFRLFCWHAFSGVSNVPKNLRKPAEDVAAECKGLPLALKVIGGTMAGKRDKRIWDHTLKKLKNAETLSSEHEMQLFHRLQPSVDDLSETHPHLKDCFYYFAAYPEDASVEFVDDLISLWVGDGIVGGRKDYSPEDEAYELLGWLIARCLIEMKIGSVSTYLEYIEMFRLPPFSMTFKVHDVLRDLARYNLQHDKVHEQVCLYEPGMQLETFPQKWIPDNKVERKHLSAKRLSLMDNLIHELPSHLAAPELRVLLLRRNENLSLLPRGFFLDLKQLRVLDLSRTSIEEIPDAAFSTMKRLVLLNLSRCEQLKSVPGTICKLEELRDLQLDHCKKLVSLPRTIKDLRKLENLNLFWTNVLRWDRPNGMRGTLSKRIKRTAHLQDVASLTSLTTLRISNLPFLLSFYYSDSDSDSDLSPEPSHPFPLQLSCLKSLRHLQVNFIRVSSLPDISNLTALQTLDLSWCKDLLSLPLGVESLPELRRLNLHKCSSLTHLPALDELPNLECLHISGCRHIKQLPNSFGRPDGFPSLTELDMYACKEVSMDEFPVLRSGAMPALRMLMMHGWHQMKKLPPTLNSLMKLQYIKLSSCFELKKLDETFDWSVFTDLEELDLNGTISLIELPPSLASLPKLRILDLRECGAGDNLSPEFTVLVEQNRLMIRV